MLFSGFQQRNAINVFVA